MITEKIKLLTASLAEKEKAQIFKAMPTLMAISYEDLKANIETLLSSGIGIRKVSQIKICALDKETLNDRLRYAKENNLMEKVVKDPCLLTDARIFSRVVEVKETAPVPEVKKNEDPIEEILNSDEIVSLNEETFQRYQVLSDCANHIIETINTKSLSKDNSIYENLTKLICKNISDEVCLYMALTHNKNYPSELLEKIKSAIDSELSLLKKMNEGMGLMSA